MPAKGLAVASPSMAPARVGQTSQFRGLGVQELLCGGMVLVPFRGPQPMARPSSEAALGLGGGRPRLLTGRLVGCRLACRRLGLS